MAAIDWSELFKKYKGLWVALLDDEKTVVGSGKTPQEAVERAKNQGHQKPILFHVPERIVPFVGAF